MLDALLGARRPWTVANAAARAALVVTADDVGRVAKQLDTGVLYMLADTTPTWTQVGGSGGGGSGSLTGVLCTDLATLTGTAGQVVVCVGYSVPGDGGGGNVVGVT